jgi:hypothetical protein
MATQLGGYEGSLRDREGVKEVEESTAASATAKQLNLDAARAYGSTSHSNTVGRSSLSRWPTGILPPGAQASAERCVLGQ